MGPSAKTNVFVLVKPRQGELDLCRCMHIGIGPAVVHKCPQLLASLEIHYQNFKESRQHCR